MMPLADREQCREAGKKRVAGGGGLYVAKAYPRAGDDGDGHGALQIAGDRAASAVLTCPQACIGQSPDIADGRSVLRAHKFVIAQTLKASKD